MITAAICARAGSTGIRDKNLQLVAGQSLLTHGLAKAFLARMVETIVVSTDYPHDLVATHALGIPFTYRIRPDHLRGPEVPKMAVWRHLAADLPRDPGAYLIDIDLSRPLTLATDIETVLDTATAREYDGAMAIAPARKTPWQDMLTIGRDGVDVAMRIEGRSVTSRHQAPPCYVYGGLTAVRVTSLLDQAPADWADLRLKPHQIPWLRSYDIDDAVDLAIVRQVLGPRMVSHG